MLLCVSDLSSLHHCTERGTEFHFGLLELNQSYQLWYCDNFVWYGRRSCSRFLILYLFLLDALQIIPFSKAPWKWETVSWIVPLSRWWSWLVYVTTEESRIWDPKTRNTERGESRVEFTFQRRWGDSWDTVIVFVLCITEAPSSRFQTTPQQSTCAAGDIRFLSDGSSSQKPRQLLHERPQKESNAKKI